MKNKVEKTQRSLFGKIVKYTFIGFNILMLVWFIGGMASTSKGIENATTEAEQAGATIGTGLGAIFIIFIWVVEAIILGIMTLLTRAKRK
jgi:hypothetical protein